jgi:hypothetical protein
MPRLHALRSEDVRDAAACLVRFQKLRNESITWLDSEEVACIIVSPKYRARFQALIDSIPPRVTPARGTT